MNRDDPFAAEMVSQNAGTFCLSEYKRPMASKNRLVGYKGEQI